MTTGLPRAVLLAVFASIAAASAVTGAGARPPVRTVATTQAPRVVSYVAPMAGAPVVVRGFSPPTHRYGPGHLGVDLRVAAGARVIAAGDGLVVFAGPVAGRGVVVLLHADGIRTEYEPVRATVRRGERVRRGTVLGVVAGRHPGCPGWCLHWGARRGANYLDPLSLLSAPGPVRLEPWPVA